MTRNIDSDANATILVAFTNAEYFPNVAKLQKISNENISKKVFDKKYFLLISFFSAHILQEYFWIFQEYSKNEVVR